MIIKKDLNLLLNLILLEYKKFIVQYSKSFIYYLYNYYIFSFEIKIKLFYQIHIFFI